ncbi:MAG TPA: ribosome silencing factor [Longimicrobiales bacterium]|nr:ribosome silencing factor [Longimicrobiales bacterium]
MPADRKIAPQEPSTLESSELTDELARAVDLARDRKARGLLVLDLRGISTATDFFFIATGTSDIHVRGIAEHIIEELKKKGVRPDHVEGLRGGRWVLIDYIDFVVHVFHPAARDFYQLERLWGDAPHLALES